MIQKIIDDTTFGDNPADIYLAKLLNQPEYYYFIKKIGKYLSKYDYIIKSIKIENETVYKYILQIIKKEYINMVKKNIANQLIQDLVRNHINTKVKILLKQCKKY